VVAVERRATRPHHDPFHCKPRSEKTHTHTRALSKLSDLWGLVYTARKRKRERARRRKQKKKHNATPGATETPLPSLQIAGGGRSISSHSPLSSSPSGSGWIAKKCKPPISRLEASHPRASSAD